MQHTAAPTRLPRPLPLVGHALHLLRDPWGFLTTTRDVGDLVEIRFGVSRAYIVHSPDLIRHLLVVEPKKYGKGVQFDKLRPVLGNGLATADAEDHRRHRRLVQPAFHHSRIDGYARTMSELTAQKSASWREGVPVALDKELTGLTLTIVAKTLFTTDLGQDAVGEMLRSVPIVLGGVMRRALDPTQLMERLPTPANRRFDQANRRLHTVIDRIIAEYRRSDADHGDVVSMLLQARDEATGAGLSDAQVRDEVVTMLVAGTETTANTLSWTFHVLGRRRDLETRLHAEVDGVGAIRDAELTVEDVGRLTFTRQMITETLRMHPPAWLLSRRTLAPVTLGGVDLPAGAMVIFSPYSVHRDPRTYGAADVFDPDRWLPERAEQIPRPAFIPFGAGTRQCIGEGYAWVMATIILATIARRWRLCPVPGVAVRMMPRMTMEPSALPMMPQARS